MKIRARLTADADMLAVLADVGNRFHSNAMPHLFREPPSGDFGSQPPGGSESEILVAEIEEKVIAFVDVCIQHMAETDVTIQRDVGVVNRIVVAEEYRNQA